jgi:hypothetical protein
MRTDSMPEGKRSIPYPRDDLKIAIPFGHPRTGLTLESAFPGLSPSSAALALLLAGGR